MGLSIKLKNNDELIKRNNNIRFEINKLRYFFKLKIEKAIDAVIRLYETDGTIIGEDLIKSIYYRPDKINIETLINDNDEFLWFDQLSEEYKEELKKELIDRYPRDIREKVKKRQK